MDVGVLHTSRVSHIREILQTFQLLSNNTLFPDMRRSSPPPQQHLCQCKSAASALKPQCEAGVGERVWRAKNQAICVTVLPSLSVPAWDFTLGRRRVIPSNAFPSVSSRLSFLSDSQWVI